MIAPPPPVLAAALAPASSRLFSGGRTGRAPGVARWRPLIAEASQRFGVPQAWIAAVMRVESAGQPSLDGRPITSPTGAMGLMQLMPQTWASLRLRYRLGSDPYAPRDNILAGAAYLHVLYARYGYPNLFAAYNTGPGRLDAYLVAGRPLPPETIGYLAALGQARPALAVKPGLRASGSLFFVLNGRPEIRAATRRDDLFVRLTEATPTP